MLHARHLVAPQKLTLINPLEMCLSVAIFVLTARNEVDGKNYGKAS